MPRRSAARVVAALIASIGVMPNDTIRPNSCAIGSVHAKPPTSVPNAIFTPAFIAFWNDGQRAALAVAAAGGGVGRIVVVVVDRERRHEPRPLAQHLRDGGVVEVEAVLDRVAAAVERAMQPLAAGRVARPLVLPRVRLVDDRAQLLDRERRLRHEIALLVEPRAVRHVDLDPVGAVVELLARGLARLDRAVDDLHALRHLDLRRVALERIAAGRGDAARAGEG